MTGAFKGESLVSGEKREDFARLPSELTGDSFGYTTWVLRSAKWRQFGELYLFPGRPSDIKMGEYPDGLALSYSRE